MGDARRRKALLGDVYGTPPGKYPRRSGSQGSWCLTRQSDATQMILYSPFPSLDAAIRQLHPDISHKKLSDACDRLCDSGRSQTVLFFDIPIWIEFCEHIPYEEASEAMENHHGIIPL